MGKHSRTGAHRSTDNVVRGAPSMESRHEMLTRARSEIHTCPRRPEYRLTWPASAVIGAATGELPIGHPLATAAPASASRVMQALPTTPGAARSSVATRPRLVRAATLSVGVGAVLAAVSGIADATPPPSAADSPSMAVSAEVGYKTRPALRPPPVKPVVRTPAVPPHPRAVRPAQGIVTSAFGPRWQAVHYGLDIANDIGAPIFSPSDGVVVESGPASGFGLWVRIRQDDGTIGVYGHINESLVTPGQRVETGQQVATVGNRGNSTGPHLHYEVWQSQQTKLDPAAWLRARGVSIG